MNIVNQTQHKVWIFGDESGTIGRGRFFGVGVFGTRNPEKVEDILKGIRNKTNFFGEVSYKSSDDKRALCAIRWQDWFFSSQDLASFKIVVKDQTNFDHRYFRNNYFDSDSRTLAYCESYREVLTNFADFSEDRKIFTYSQVSLSKLSVPEYLERVLNLSPEDCFMGSPKERKPHSLTEFTRNADILQLTDLLTSSTVGLYNSLHKEVSPKSWVKNTLHLNLCYHLPNLKQKIAGLNNYYHPSFLPYSTQKYVIYCWQPSQMPKHL